MTSHHCCEYQSLRQRFTGSEEKDLLLIVESFGASTLQVHLVNKFFGRQCKSLFKKLAFTLIIGGVLIVLRTAILWQCFLLNVGFFLWFLKVLLSFRGLVKQEKFLYCNNLGMYLQSQTLFGTSNLFITSSHIYDIVINEVCENLNYRYILIVRSKGSLFKKSPIIPVFKYLKPSWDCLGFIYKQLKSTS